MLLIIDDDIAVCTSLSLLLRKEGFDVAAVQSPEDALNVLRRHEVALVLLDMNFSNDTTGDDGLALLAQLKIINPTLPVVLITGWATIDLAVKGMKLGAADFLNKPWQNNHLVQSLRTALRLAEGKGQIENATALPFAQSPKPTANSRRLLDKQFDFGQIVGETPHCYKYSKR